MAKQRDFIINDSTTGDLIFHPDLARGLDLSSRPTGFAYGGTAEPFPASLIIPKSEWQARIKEMEDKKSRIPDLCDQAGLTVKDQQQTNYCWINAPTHTVEITRVIQNESLVVLSAASAGAQIKNYRNEGGWGKEGLEWIGTNGLVPEANWPKNAISPKYATAENKALALSYRQTEWWELEPNNLDQLVSCLLMRFPVAIGLGWWSHEVTAVSAKWIDGAIAIEIDNSWGVGWGTNGRGVLQGNHMLPDDAVTPRVALGS